MPLCPQKRVVKLLSGLQFCFWLERRAGDPWMNVTTLQNCELGAM